MQTISINFIIPQGWHELSDRQLRYVYKLIDRNFSSDEIKTLCLLRWTGTKVVGRQVSGSYLLQKGKILFEVTPLTLAELLPHLDWLSAMPLSPVRLSKIKRQHALPADFSDVPFQTFIICDNLYQGYLQTKNDDLLNQLGGALYGKQMKLKPYQRISVFYWFATLKDFFSRKYSDFFQPFNAAADGNLLGSPTPTVEEAMNAQIRALTKGDVTKETDVLALDTQRALTELNAQAREYKQMNAQLNKK